MARYLVTRELGRRGERKNDNLHCNELPGKSFLEYSDEEIDNLFKVLHSLPSPQREEAFVQYCLDRTPPIFH